MEALSAETMPGIAANTAARQQRSIAALKVSAPQAYLGAVLLTALASIVRLALLPTMSSGYPLLTFYPSILLSAYLFGARPALLSTVVGLVVAWLFFVTPDNSYVFGVVAPVAAAFYLLIAVLAIGLMHTMQLANARLAAERDNSVRLIENRELLFRELQHRVGNSLQLVASVLALQRRKLAEPEAIGAIDEASRRVALIGKVQRQLYDPSGAPLTLAPFLSEICADLLAAAGKPGIVLRFQGGGDALLPPDLAIPTALVLSEAVVNAIEHGFAARDTGTIVVIVSVEGTKLVVVVEDDGTGLPDDFDFDCSQNLGLRLAHKLASYHGGAVTLERGDGTTVARIELSLAR